MNQMTIVDVVKLLYPNQVELGNVVFGQDRNNPIFITKWDVSGVEQPQVAELEARIPELQNQFDITTFEVSGKILLSSYLNQVAQERQYDSAISCASYINSTVLEWSSEAAAFITWRDSVFTYLMEQMELMVNGSRTIPTFQEFKTELPIITWP